MQEIIDWLKTSIIGIILLGAIGSILAAITIYICVTVTRLLITKPFRTIMVRRNQVGEGVVAQLVKAQPYAPYYIWVAAKLLEAMLAIMSFYAMCVVNLIYFMSKGITNPVLAVVLIAIHLLTLYSVIFSYGHVTGIERVKLWAEKNLPPSAPPSAQSKSDTP